ncbi:MAG: hypothetical protein JSV79_00855 [Armatimonadota bacterium]|nr:MAG: hypothetical protein JSV79_00855 [Armatimonadota bacterium]
MQVKPSVVSALLSVALIWVAVATTVAVPAAAIEIVDEEEASSIMVGWSAPSPRNWSDAMDCETWFLNECCPCIIVQCDWTQVCYGICYWLCNPGEAPTDCVTDRKLRKCCQWYNHKGRDPQSHQCVGPIGYINRFKGVQADDGCLLNPDYWNTDPCHDDT